ncbi:hypothetical protein T492DRAFT_1012047 [Pavlovales sp. CCMP2436]|nr:hypothetical protein T492DRAFT_1012047 [Pavlovales sp. CCMP2436]
MASLHPNIYDGPGRPQPSGASAYASLASGVSLYEPEHPVLATVARRKMAAAEVEALENRIKRLELEEVKARKGVEQVREKNSVIQQAQERTRQVVEQRATLERGKRQEVERLKEVAQKRKEQQRQNLQKAFTGMYNERLGEARQHREEQERVVEEAARAREREREKNYGRNDQIRTRRKELSLRVQQQRIAHQEYLMQDFINMIQNELEQTEEIERDIERLDSLESEHVERIRELQEEQRAAYDRLEQALTA